MDPCYRATLKHPIHRNHSTVLRGINWWFFKKLEPDLRAKNIQKTATVTIESSRSAKSWQRLHKLVAAFNSQQIITTMGMQLVRDFTRQAMVITIDSETSTHLPLHLITEEESIETRRPTHASLCLKALFYLACQAALNKASLLKTWAISRSCNIELLSRTTILKLLNVASLQIT